MQIIVIFQKDNQTNLDTMPSSKMAGDVNSNCTEIEGGYLNTLHYTRLNMLLQAHYLLDMLFFLVTMNCTPKDKL